MVLWSAGYYHPKQWSQRVINWHFTAWDALSLSARWLYLGKTLSWKKLFCWIDFKKYYKITHTSSLCVTQECVFSNYETWCYLQPKKVLFDSSGNSSWMSPDYNFYFSLSIFFSTSGPTFIYTIYIYVYIYTQIQQNCSVLVSWLMKDDFRKKLQAKIIWRSSGWHCWIIIISNKTYKS